MTTTESIKTLEAAYKALHAKWMDAERRCDREGDAHDSAADAAYARMHKAFSRYAAALAELTGMDCKTARQLIERRPREVAALIAQLR